MACSPSPVSFGHCSLPPVSAFSAQASWVSFAFLLTFVLPLLQGGDASGDSGVQHYALLGPRLWWPVLGTFYPLSPVQCSAPCGGGVQRRLVKCVNTQTGLAEEDSDQCGHEAWPESSRPCATEDCELVEPPRECLPTPWGWWGRGRRRAGTWRLIQMSVP